MESREGGVLIIGKAGKEVPVCVWHQHRGREGFLVDWVALEQEEAAHVRGDCVHATFLKDNLAFVNTEHFHLSVIYIVDIFGKLTPVFVSCSLIKIKKVIIGG